MPDITREQVLQIFKQRYAKHLGSTEDETVHEVDPEIISALRGPGGEIADWHFKAFAEIDDLIVNLNAGDDKKVSIKQVCNKYSNLGHSHRYDSFEGMYYEFKRDKEFDYRRRGFAEHLFAGNKEEALEHLYRLLLIVDVDSLFGSQE